MLVATIPYLSYRIFVGVKSRRVKGSIELEGTSKIPGNFAGSGNFSGYGDFTGFGDFAGYMVGAVSKGELPKAQRSFE